MKIIRAQKQRLPHDPLVALSHLGKHGYVPRPKDVGEGAVDGPEVGDELGFVPDCGADGDVERAWGTDGFLDQVGERPGAAQVGDVGGVVGGVDGR